MHFIGVETAKAAPDFCRRTAGIRRRSQQMRIFCKRADILISSVMSKWADCNLLRARGMHLHSVQVVQVEQMPPPLRNIHKVQGHISTLRACAGRNAPEFLE